MGVESSCFGEEFLELVEIDLFVLFDDLNFELSDSQELHFVGVGGEEGDPHSVDGVGVAPDTEAQGVGSADEVLSSRHGDESVSAQLFQNGSCDFHSASVGEDDSYLNSRL